MRGTWIQLSVLLLGLSLTDGFLTSSSTSCIFTSPDPEDITLIYSVVFNKLELLRFNSSVGRFVGYTEFGVKEAEYWNSDPSVIDRWRAEKDRYCVHNVNIYYTSVLNNTAKPYAVLNSAPSGGSERVLVCSVYGFYPKDITVSWTNHHQPITAGVTTTDLLQDSDWYYQVHSQLVYSPRSGDLISCVIEHASLSEPMILNWDRTLPDADRWRLAVGASGVLLALVVTGFTFYKHQARGQKHQARGQKHQARGQKHQARGVKPASSKQRSGSALLWMGVALLLVLGSDLVLHVCLWFSPGLVSVQ